MLLEQFWSPSMEVTLPLPFRKITQTRFVFFSALYLFWDSLIRFTRSSRVNLPLLVPISSFSPWQPTDTCLSPLNANWRETVCLRSHFEIRCLCLLLSLVCFAFVAFFLLWLFISSSIIPIIISVFVNFAECRIHMVLHGCSQAVESVGYVPPFLSD